MKKNPVAMIAAGALVILVGLVMMFMGGTPKADPAMVAQCQTKLRAQNMDASSIKQCDEKAFATAMTATDANAAAKAISAANNQEIGGSSLAMLLIGIGAALAAFGAFTMRARRV